MDLFKREDLLVDNHKKKIVEEAPLLTWIFLLNQSSQPRYRPIFEHHGVGQEGDSGRGAH